MHLALALMLAYRPAIDAPQTAHEERWDHPGSVKLSNGDVLRFSVGVAMADATRYGVTLPSQKLTSGSKSLDLRRLSWTWLDGRHDAVLGPGKIANDMRYANTSAIKLLPYFAQVFPAGDHALAIVNWRWEKTDRYQHLARIDTRPSLKITLLRPLDTYPVAQYPPLVDRIVSVSGKLLLLAANHIEIIDKSGVSHGTYASLPKGFPEAVVNNRWLLWHEDQYAIDSYDLRQKKLTPLVSWAKGNMVDPWWELVKVAPGGKSVFLFNTGTKQYFEAPISGGSLRQVSAPAN